MPTVEIHIPQIGEGLQEARLVATLKRPGDTVRRDEPIYQMETDKAVMDVESPYAGTLVEWLAEDDTVLPIGAAIARMEIAAEAGITATTPEPTPAVSVEGIPAEATSPEAAAPTSGLRGIPPRTRAYATEKGISQADLAALAGANAKLMPADIDAFLAKAPAAKSGRPASENPVGGKQRVLNSRMVRSNGLVVPGSMTIVCGWSVIEEERAKAKAGGGEFQPSAFTMFAFCVAQTLKDFPVFRTVLPNDETFRTYDRASLGIAVARPGDELLLAVVDEADAMNWPDFANAMRARIDDARGGKDQAHEAVTVSLTNMQAFGLRDAVPVVVAPSMATIFLGEPYWSLGEDAKPRRTANIGMTFDHRIANGVGAAEFLKAIKTKVEAIGTTLS